MPKQIKLKIKSQEMADQCQKIKITKIIKSTNQKSKQMW